VLCSPAHDRVVVVPNATHSSIVRSRGKSLSAPPNTPERVDSKSYDIGSKYSRNGPTVRRIARRRLCRSNVRGLPSTDPQSSRAAFEPPPSPTDNAAPMTPPPPPRADPEEDSAATSDRRRPVTSDHCTTDAAAIMSAPTTTAADNVAYFRPAAAAEGDADDRHRRTSATNGGRHASGAPDRHQLPPSTLTPVQFEMSYGTPAAADHNAMSSKDNLLTPRGQFLL